MSKLLNQLLPSRKKKPGLGLKISTPPPPVQEAPYQFSQTGTFSEGDLRINSKGMVINKKDSPNTSPVSSSSSSSSSPTASSGDYLGISGIDDVEMLEIIGSGASGTVRKARLRSTQDLLAVKIMKLDVTEGVRQKLLNELRTLYQCRHPFVVDFKGAFFRDGSISIAMEFMDGGTIADLLKKTTTIPEKVIALVLKQLLDAFDYIHHDLHIVHRDVKPQNILIGLSNGVTFKLCDFGVSGKLEHTIGKASTFTGTLTYMSPERIQGDYHSVTSDIWSLGLTMLECAIGKFPYHTQDNITFFELLEMIQTKPSPNVPEDDDSFSPEFRSFISLCLQKDPADRPSARELLSHAFLKLHENSAEEAKTWVSDALNSSSSSSS